MATIDWPTSLPQNFLQDGYSEGNIDNLYRTGMDVGPEKRRPKSTTAEQPVVGKMHLTNAQKSIFLDFYLNTLGSGASPFNMPVYGGGTVDTFIDSQTIAPKSGITWTLSMNIRRLIS